jgi:hypothetical protein
LPRANNNATDQVEDFTTPPAGPNCTTLSVGSILSKEILTIYPNPTSGIITLNMESLVSSNLTVQVYDLNGRMVYNEALSGFSGEKSLNLSHLMSGVYLVKVNTDTSQYSVKLMKN